MYSDQAAVKAANSNKVRKPGRDVPGFFLDRKHMDWYNVLRVTGKN